jgi:L-iditol 2-dehydrogenase
MLAAVVESPDHLVVKEIPRPRLGEYGALCQMLFGATCTGTDQHLIANLMPWRVDYPIVLGHESVGRVIEVGSKVRHFRVGDLISRVGTHAYPEIGLNLSWGGYCEFGLAMDHRAMREDGRPSAEWDAYRVNQVIPPDLDPAACTMMITWRETLSYIRRVGVTRGSHVLVLGTGGNGLAYLAHSRNLGATTITCVGSSRRETLARQIGATHFVDYSADQIDQTLRNECGEFDFIIDSVGKAKQVDRVLTTLRPGGMVAIYGLDDFDSMGVNPLYARGTFSIYGGGYDEEESHQEVISRMRDGSLDARHWLNLNQPYDLKQIGEAFEALRERCLVKALIRLSPDA